MLGLADDWPSRRVVASSSRLSSSSFAVDSMHEDAELKGRPQPDVVLIVLITFVPHAAPDVGILDFKF